MPYPVHSPWLEPMSSYNKTAIQKIGSKWCKTYLGKQSSCNAANGGFFDDSKLSITKLLFQAEVLTIFPIHFPSFSIDVDVFWVIPNFWTQV